MATQQVRANQAVADDLGRVAFRRGPIIFCMESIDQPGHADEANLSPFSAALDGETKAVWNPELLGGVEVLEHPGADITIDLESTTLTLPTGQAVRFPLEPFARYCLTTGVDELGFLLGREREIGAYESSRG